jgi:hypothetical protein
LAITTQNGLVAAIAAGRTVQFYKASITAVGGFWYTTFRGPGMPGAAAAPGTAAGQTLSRTSTGAMPIPAPSNTSYISSFEGTCNIGGSFMLADRLVETGALSGITTTAQTVNSVALPARATGATDVELWLEWYTVGGNTASATVTASYTNQAGTSGRTATLIGGFPATGTPVNRSYQMALQAGDTGVQSVQTVTSTTSTGTAGAFGVVLRRSLVFGIVPSANMGFVMGYAETDLQILADDACVEVLCLASTTSTGGFQGNFGVAQG